jgi:hypothetical protein
MTLLDGNRRTFLKMRGAERMRLMQPRSLRFIHITWTRFTWRQIPEITKPGLGSGA